MNILTSKYLSSSPIEWLLDESDPSISYLTRRDILEDDRCNDLYPKIAESPEFVKLLGKTGNILGDQKNYDLYYSGTVWCFAEAVERGLDRRSPVIRETAEFIVSRCQTPDGGFSLKWKPRVELACRTGDMIRLLVKAGFDDNNVRNGITWITSHQRHDGGWLHCPLAGMCDQFRLILFNRPGKGLARESNNAVKSCFYATIACSMALAEYAEKTGSRANDHILKKAADFFLKRSLFKNSGNEPIRPRSSWNRDFRLLGYPVMSQYDILYGLLFIARAGFLGDRRAGEAFNLVMSKQNGDGTWNMENARTGMMYGNEPKKHAGKKSNWVTLQVMRLLKLHGSVIGAAPQ
ncbi:MAG TPA: prenyltransferase/squalene oxidase repeat-containing protein [Spirochaetota bacterium]|nr:prenyltransferase/squalene oxidase repeat-containing protein [Spirochaetota bacterium]HPC39507.1 prenyltransferase/squalene oxidase repeat-containing protein [Spirochaetota bacterium]HPL17555.1 prenyltransferase/squalene oxidase repeat-containing protein [Spirochaetota bacterium]HQF06845.1 prenyltransferase/squalene oxidase repeat-containing protein [Spirochaetota bacterium]HQH95536.1 prenyltransferase/squalene oxidase repeat-containing protein [Spirochaetota bacterium]